MRTPETSYAGAFAWRHAQGNDEIEFFDPLGRTVAVIQRRPGALTLRLPDGRSYRVTEPGDEGVLGSPCGRPEEVVNEQSTEALPRQVLGRFLPWTALALWVQGWPSGSHAAVARDEEGLPRLLEEAGVRVQYGGFQATARGLKPSRLNVLCSGELEIKLIVDAWHEVEASSP